MGWAIDHLQKWPLSLNLGNGSVRTIEATHHKVKQNLKRRRRWWKGINLLKLQATNPRKLQSNVSQFHTKKHVAISLTWNTFFSEDLQSYICHIIIFTKLLENHCYLIKLTTQFLKVTMQYAVLERYLLLKSPRHIYLGPLFKKNMKRGKHIVYKLIKMSHWILAFSTNFCPIKTDLFGNTIWPQASRFQKLAKMDHFWHF